MIDAAWPPLGAGVKADIINRYIGGSTPHVWTQAETDQMLRESGARGILPNFVRVPPTTRDPRVEAAWCVQWMQAHGQPTGTCIALDYETAVNNAYWTAFDDVIMAGGYRTLLYGTLRTVVQNVTPGGRRPSAGYWSAHWNNTPHICTNAGVTATQYGGDTTIGKPWDVSLVGDHVPIWGYEGGTMSAAGPEHWDAADVGRFRELLSSWLVGGTLADQGVNNVLDLPAAFVATQPLVQGIVQAVKTAGISVTVDLSQASPEQLDALAKGIAGHLAVMGQSYAGTIDLQPKPA
jgi:hypothetical protein